MMGRWVKALTRNRAQTHPGSPDPRLRGRCYTIPFDQVWTAATLLADSGLPGWSVRSWNDREGVIQAEARTRIFRWVDEVTIRISLDANAQTRVDVTSKSQKGAADLGANARRIISFLKALDAKLDATPEQILTPSASSRPSVGYRA